jgi:tetratricopeptide (TPR) repeat protein
VHAALEWSVHSLEPADRELLYAASTMCGEWTVRDVAAIADLGVDQAQASVLRGVDAGLVEPQASTGADAKYRMPGILQRLLYAELDQEARDTLSERHCLHLIGLLCEGVSHLKGPNRLHWLDLLDRYRQDLAKAFEFTLRRGAHPSTLVEAMVLSWSYWYDRNRSQEALELIRRAIRACPDKKHLDVARLLNIAGILCFKSGSMPEGRRYFKRALRICAKGRHELLRASLWSNLGGLEWADADPARAARSFETGIRCLRGLACPVQLGKALVSSVDSLAELGRLQEAKAATEEADTLLRAREDPLDELTISMARGEIALAEANAAQAARAFAQCLKLAHRLGDPVTYARICLWLASAEVLLGKYERAGELLGAMESQGSDRGATLYRTHDLRLARVEGAVRAALGEKALARARLIGAIGAPGIVLDMKA